LASTGSLRTVSSRFDDGSAIACAVAAECAAFALSDASLFGTWAGMSERQRRRDRRAA
jgi:hypothetical protein